MVITNAGKHRGENHGLSLLEVLQLRDFLILTAHHCEGEPPIVFEEGMEEV